MYQYGHFTPSSMHEDVQAHYFAGGEGRRGRRTGPAPKHHPHKRKGAEAYQRFKKQYKTKA